MLLLRGEIDTESSAPPVSVSVVMTYEFDEIPRFLHELESGAGLVMGNRMSGLNPGSMGLRRR